MEQVVERLKKNFKEHHFSMDIPITDPEYLRKMQDVRENKICFAIGYLGQAKEVNKGQTLDILFLILQDKI